MTDTATLEARLAEVETALHNLRMGATVVTVKYDGREVQYSQTSVESLKQYQTELKAELGLSRPRRAIRPRF